MKYKQHTDKRNQRKMQKRSRCFARELEPTARRKQTDLNKLSFKNRSCLTEKQRPKKSSKSSMG
jgi:hypothetical protein